MSDLVFEITPYEGAGSIKFGMTKTQVHEVIGQPVDSWKAEKNLVMELYSAFDIAVGYLDGVVEYLCFYKKGKACFGGIQLNRKSLLQARDWLLRHDSNSQESIRKSSWKSDLIGILFYTTSAPNRQVSTVEIASHKYWPLLINNFRSTE